MFLTNRWRKDDLWRLPQGSEKLPNIANEYYSKAWVKAIREAFGEIGYLVPIRVDPDMDLSVDPNNGLDEFLGEFRVKEEEDG